jgi:DNA-binding HxlR family transcriptional regulator
MTMDAIRVDALSRGESVTADSSVADTVDDSVAGLLRLVGAGAGGQILMALGTGPLRTGELTELIHQFSPRSVYRYASKMHERDIVDRFEEAGVPSVVVLSLSDPPGRNLYRLLRTFAATSGARLPSEGRDFESWASLSRLGELWDLGFVEELSRGSRSLTQLAQSAPEMTYHQVNRRLGLFVSCGLLVRLQHGHLKHFGLTDHGRRRMALVASVGRWRRRHLGEGTPGLTIPEMATVLRTALPLILLPKFAGMNVDFGVSGGVDQNGHREDETLQGTIGLDGTMRFDGAVEPSANSSARGTINTWFAALLDGKRGRMQVGGELPLVDACLTQLHEVLWAHA